MLETSTSLPTMSSEPLTSAHGVVPAAAVTTAHCSTEADDEARPVVRPGISEGRRCFEEVLTEQLAATRGMLAERHEQTLSLVTEHLRAVQRLEREVAELGDENRLLRRRGTISTLGAYHDSDAGSACPAWASDEGAVLTQISFHSVPPHPLGVPGAVAPVSPRVTLDEGTPVCANPSGGFWVAAHRHSGELATEETLSKSTGFQDEPCRAFEVLATWTMVTRESLEQLREKRWVAARNMGRATLVGGFEFEREEEDGGTCSSKFVMGPGSAKRLVWDVLSLLLVLFDMIVVPMSVFDPPESAFTTAMTWITRTFWTLDILVAFFSGVVMNDGRTIMGLTQIANRYVRRWFLFDVLIVGVDWLEVVFQRVQMFGYVRLGKSSRLFKILRLIRLLRVVRMSKYDSMITEHVASEKIAIAAHGVKITMFTLALAHLAACAWYGVGNLDYSTSWIKHYELDREPWGVRYLTALHWGASQFSGGMDEFHPQNALERSYAVSMFIGAYLISTLVVSALTSTMTKLEVLANDRHQMIASFRRWLQQNGISRNLMSRAQRNAQHALIEHNRFVPEERVELLQLTSDALRAEIRLEMFSPILSVHPFFRKYALECPQVMRKVCHEAISWLLANGGDVLFSAGERAAAPKMYIVSAGTLTYTDPTGGYVVVSEREWIAEANLWTKWMHQGELKAQAECRLCVVDSQKFQSIVSSFDHLRFDPRKYAAAYVLDMNKWNCQLLDIVPPSFGRSALGRRAASRPSGSRAMVYLVKALNG